MCKRVMMDDQILWNSVDTYFMHVCFLSISVNANEGYTLLNMDKENISFLSEVKTSHLCCIRKYYIHKRPGVFSRMHLSKDLPCLLKDVF